ncbi:MAG: RNA polymerase sigma factor [Anaerolineaceae bacterium]|nr:RNA polymerase sigma factor [Anaerolineaceae bacterium]
MSTRIKDRSNEEWLAALRDRDSAAFAPALEDLRAHLRRAVYFYLSQERSDLISTSIHDLHQLAEDLAQDATLRVLDHLDTFLGAARFTTWATKIAVRLAISELRRVRYRNFSLDAMTARFIDEESSQSGAFEDEMLPAEYSANVGSLPNPSPEVSLERDEFLRSIQQALQDSLTARQRQALIAVVFHGVPLEVVAEQLGTNRNALYKLLHDARRKLRSHMEAEGLSFEYMQRIFSS